MFTVGQKIRCVDTQAGGQALTLDRVFVVREVSAKGVRVDDPETGRKIPYEYDFARFVEVEAPAANNTADAPTTDAQADNAADAPTTDAQADNAADAPTTDAQADKSKGVPFGEILGALLFDNSRGSDQRQALRATAHVLEGLAGLLRALASK